MQREARQRASLAKIVRYYRTHLAIRAKREVELTLDRHDAWDEAILHRPMQCAGARDDARACRENGAGSEPLWNHRRQSAPRGRAPRGGWRKRV